MDQANSRTTTDTRVAGKKKADEAQAESAIESQVPTEDLQADLDDNNQMMSEGGPSG
jgi:hypothetical protein